MKVTRSNKKIIFSVVMTLMIALAMVPGMAFASTQVPANDNVAAVAEDSIAIAPLTETVYVGDQKTMAAAVNTAVTPYHVEWTSSNTSVATISKKNAKLIGLSAGTTTITATLLTGTDEATDATVLATDSINVTVLATEAYGFQGTGGQTMKLISPENIVVTQIVKDGTGAITKYINTITDKVSASAATFKFTMTAGMNNFNEDTFINVSLPEIKVMNADGSSTGINPDYVGYNSSTKTIELNVAGLAKGTSYILQFGAGVQGNNSDKTLGAPIEFNFATKTR